MGLSRSFAFAQTTGSVKGVCKDVDGKPIAQAEVEWLGPKPATSTPQNQQQGRVLLARHRPRQVQRQAQQRRQGTLSHQRRYRGLDETTLDFDLKKEQARRSPGPGIDSEQAKARQEAAAKAANEKKTVGTLNEKLKAAKTASDAGTTKPRSPL
jgi:hypothetical protein